MKIRDNNHYKKAVHEVYVLMSKGEAKITHAEAKKIEQLAKAIEDYEDNVLKIMPLKVTVSSIVQEKIEELNITQSKLAEMLDMGVAKLNQILNRKRKPDVPFLKAIHEKLGVDGNLILENV